MLKQFGRSLEGHIEPRPSAIKERGGVGDGEKCHGAFDGG
jgi:hypothetical protein